MSTISETVVYRIESNVEVPSGKSTIQYVFKKTDDNQGQGKLLINGQQIGQGVIGSTFPFKVSFEGLDIGRDTLYPVSKAYENEGAFAFSGKIEKVVYNLE